MTPLSPKSGLQRHTPLGRRAKGKGNRGEQEIIALLKAHGWTGARRNFASGGYGGGDVIGGPPATDWEIKRCERAQVWAWLAQLTAAASPTNLPVLAFRRNHSQWWACIPLEDLLELLQLRESA